MVWPRQKDARGENTIINYGMDTTGEKEKRTSKENVQAAMTTRNFEPDQWRNRERHGVWFPEDGDSCYETR